LIVLAAVVLLAILAYVNRKPATPGGEANQPVVKRDAAPTTAPSVAANNAKPAGTPILVTQTPSTVAPAQPPETDAKKPVDAKPLAAAITAPTTKPSWDLLMAAAPVGDAPPIHPSGLDPATALVEGQKRLDSGDLVAAQALLSSALTSGKLSAQQAEQIKRVLDPVGRQIVFSTRRYPDWTFGGTYQVQNGDSLQKVAKLHNITWELLGRMNDISDPRKLRAGRAIKVVNGPFGAIVNKSKFVMEIWLCGSSMPNPGEPGTLYVTSFPVGLGKSGSTPTGTWVVTPGGKQKNPKFWGAGDLPPMEADDPQNPLGEFWLALTGIDGQAEGKESYGIHGTIDPSSIGKEASMGCIRLQAEDIAMVYELLVDGKSRVIVRE
jgi:lipoprotein-anchoring transpeptidase ErfK/SrfK